MLGKTSRRILLIGARRSLKFVVLGAAVLTCTAALAAPITSGNLVLVRVAGGPNGDASAALGGSGLANQVFLDEYSTAGGAPVQTIAMPGTRSTTAGSQRALTLSGTQNMEGHITLSFNGQYLVMAGYNQTVLVTGTNNVPSGGDGVTTAIERVVGRIGLDGTINTTTALIDAMSSQSVRSAYSVDGTQFWLTGNGGNGVTIGGVATTTSGVHYAQLGFHTGGVVSTQINTSGQTSNNRVVQGYKDKLYVSNGSGSSSSVPPRGIVNDFTSGGMPTTQGTASGPSLQVLPGLSTSTTTPDDFWFFDDNTLYVADTTAAGGIAKWTFNGSTWSLQYNLVSNQLRNVADTAFVGVHSIAGTVNGLGQAVLFGTTFDGTGSASNKFFTLTDTGAASLATVLGTSATNTAFRGIEFIPIPEPGSISLVVLGVLIGAARIWRRR